MDRHEVYALIDGEREYQEARWRHTCAEANVPYTIDACKDTEEWLCFIYGYFQDAMRDASHLPGPRAALDVVRKLAGLCVACLEANGIVTRDRQKVDGPCQRRFVYMACNAEREYQDSLGEDRTDTPGSGRRTPHGELILFETYLRRAFDAWTDNPGDEPSLDVIRKLLGIAVRCMETHGAPPRVPFEAPA